MVRALTPLNAPHEAAIADDEQTGRRAHEVIKKLTGEFEQLTGTGQLTINRDTRHLFTAVFGWWVGINRSSQLVALAHTHQLGHESGPNVRSIIQHTLILQWVLDEGDPALAALIEHGESNTRKLLEDLERADWPIPPDSEQEKPVRRQSPHPLMGMIDNFADLCIAYDARKLYVAYRLLSGQIHPSPQGAMAYVDNDGMLSNHAARQTSGLLIQTAMCLIQAARSINPLLEEQPLSSSIEQAETHLGSQIGLWTRRQKPNKRSARRQQGQPLQDS